MKCTYNKGEYKKENMGYIDYEKRFCFNDYHFSIKYADDIIRILTPEGEILEYTYKIAGYYLQSYIKTIDFFKNKIVFTLDNSIKIYIKNTENFYMEILNKTQKFINTQHIPFQIIFNNSLYYTDNIVQSCIRYKNYRNLYMLLKNITKIRIVFSKNTDNYYTSYTGKIPNTVTAILNYISTED